MCQDGARPVLAHASPPPTTTTTRTHTHTTPGHTHTPPPQGHIGIAGLEFYMIEQIQDAARRCWGGMHEP